MLALFLTLTPLLALSTAHTTLFAPQLSDMASITATSGLATRSLSGSLISFNPTATTVVFYPSASPGLSAGTETLIWGPSTWNLYATHPGSIEATMKCAVDEQQKSAVCEEMNTWVDERGRTEEPVTVTETMSWNTPGVLEVIVTAGGEKLSKETGVARTTGTAPKSTGSGIMKASVSPTSEAWTFAAETSAVATSWANGAVAGDRMGMMSVIVGVVGGLLLAL